MIGGCSSVRTGEDLRAKLDAADTRWPLVYISRDGVLDMAANGTPVLYGRWPFSYFEPDGTLARTPPGGPPPGAGRVSYFSTATGTIREYAPTGPRAAYSVSRLPTGQERWRERRNLLSRLVGRAASVIVFDADGRPVSLTAGKHEGSSDMWLGRQVFTFDYEGPVRDGRRRDEPYPPTVR